MEYAVAQTSLAHTYGNITCFIASYIKELFPKNFFATTHIATTIAHKQFSIFQNSNKEFIKKSKPMLIIRPRLEVDDESVFLYDTLMTTNWHNIYYDISYTNLQPFIEDKEKGLVIKFLMNRLKMSFDVSIITETYMDAVNQAHFLKNRIPWKYSFFLPTSLESYVPRELMEVASKICEVPMYDENGSVQKFVQYLNQNSVFPVSYKMKNSTGNDEFFRYYPANVDTTFEGLSVEEGNKKGQIVDSCAIQFTVTAEFNSAGLYYLFTEKEKIIDKFIIAMKNEDRIIPLFTYDNLHVNKYGVGWVLYTSPMYSVDNNKVDILDLNPIINNSIQYVTKYHLDNGIPLELFLKIEVRKDNRPLEVDTEYEIDFKTWTLKTKVCSLKSTYRFIMHINLEYINGLMAAIYDLHEEK